MKVFTVLLILAFFIGLVNAEEKSDDTPSLEAENVAAKLAQLTLFEDLSDDRMPQVDVLTILLSFPNNESLLASLQQVIISMLEKLDLFVESRVGSVFNDFTVHIFNVSEEWEEEEPSEEIIEEVRKSVAKLASLGEPSLAQERILLANTTLDQVVSVKGSWLFQILQNLWKVALEDSESFVTSIQEVVQLMTKLIFLGNPLLAIQRIQQLKLLLKKGSNLWETPMCVSTKQAKEIVSSVSEKLTSWMYENHINDMCVSIKDIVSNLDQPSNVESLDKQSSEQIQKLAQNWTKIILLGDSSLASKRIKTVNQLPSLWTAAPKTDEQQRFEEDSQSVMKKLDELIERLIVKPAFGILDA